MIEVGGLKINFIVHCRRPLATADAFFDLAEATPGCIACFNGLAIPLDLLNLEGITFASWMKCTMYLAAVLSGKQTKITTT